ncbi:hypothetical protein TI39_contig312g00031 [Zymoseptoria brevis]|uniref:Uncharacterized protein n=1 Tax=Zymoseptoria brevis TaxID=1047168 RepID=A0A0F4GU74_9PEZI|nr:hypothetical protein TI39_contig312g00031 [Zymoseptoria brevis]
MVRTTSRSRRAEFDARQAAWAKQAERESRQAALAKVEANQAREVQQAAENLLHFAQGEEDASAEDGEAEAVAGQRRAEPDTSWTPLSTSKANARGSQADRFGPPGNGERVPKKGPRKSLIVVLRPSSQPAEASQEEYMSSVVEERAQGRHDSAVELEEDRSAVMTAALTRLTCLTTRLSPQRAEQLYPFGLSRLPCPLTIPATSMLSGPMRSATVSTSIEQKSIISHGPLPGYFSHRGGSAAATDCLRREESEPSCSSTSTPMSPYPRTSLSEPSTRESISSVNSCTNSPQPATRNIAASRNNPQLAFTNTRDSKHFWNVVMAKEDSAAVGLEDVKPPVGLSVREDTPPVTQSYRMPNSAVYKALSALPYAGDDQMEAQPGLAGEHMEADIFVVNDERTIMDDTATASAYCQVRNDRTIPRQQDAPAEDQSTRYDRSFQNEVAPEDSNREPPGSLMDTTPDQAPEGHLLPSERETIPEAPHDQEHDPLDIHEDPYSMDIDTDPPNCSTRAPDSPYGYERRNMSWEDPDYFLHYQEPARLVRTVRRSDVSTPRMSPRPNGLQPDKRQPDHVSHLDEVSGRELRDEGDGFDVDSTEMHDAEERFNGDLPSVVARSIECQDRDADDLVPPDEAESTADKQVLREAPSQVLPVVEAQVSEARTTDEANESKTAVPRASLELESESGRTIETGKVCGLGCRLPVKVEKRQRQAEEEKIVDPYIEPDPAPEALSVLEVDPEQEVEKALEARSEDVVDAKNSSDVLALTPVPESSDDDSEEEAEGGSNDPMLLDQLSDRPQTAPENIPDSPENEQPTCSSHDEQKSQPLRETFKLPSPQLPPLHIQECQLPSETVSKSSTSASRSPRQTSQALLRQARKKEGKKARLLARQTKGMSNGAVQSGRVSKQKRPMPGGKKGKKGKKGVRW